MPRKDEINSILEEEYFLRETNIDQVKREFLKLIFSTGIATFFLMLFNRKTNALTFGQSVNFDSSYTTKIDAADSNTTYIGNALPDTLPSEASWQIKRVSVSGTVTSIEWAGGIDSYVNVWDDRASLSYS